MSEISPPANPIKQMKLSTNARKKESHNTVERRRRYKITDRIEELGKVIPNSYFSGGKLNKGIILAATVKYVKQLEKENQLLRKMQLSMHQSEESIATLHAELKDAKRQLHTERFLQQNKQLLQSSDPNYNVSQCETAGQPQLQTEYFKGNAEYQMPFQYF